VFKVVEDMQGSVVQNIKTNFLLPEELARYVATAMVVVSVLSFISHIIHMQFSHLGNILL
jgi:hypothetical protein